MDLPQPSGAPATPVELSRRGSHYRGVGLYDVPTPTIPAAMRAAWVRGETIPLQEIDQSTGGLGFVKVSAFGTVIRAIALVEDPVVLGKPVKWAFGDGPILVVADAGRLENAFYDRESRSLQFFSYERPGAPRRYYTALSQDIVTHETGHALLDGIAPDLCDAGFPESLAIHESVADLTAVMVSLRSRDPFQHRPEPAAALESALASSRYSRVAEEFGRSRGDVDALRDASNRRSLDSRVRAQARVVDRLSPHSLSQVLTGAVFSVLQRSLATTLSELEEAGSNPHIGIGGSAAQGDPFRIAGLYAINRLGSLIYKGMDWLPPGEATMADAVRAMLAADEFHHPDLPAERIALIDECARRRIATRAQLHGGTRHAVVRGSEGDREALLTDPDRALQFVWDHREKWGIPEVPLEVTSIESVRLQKPLLQRRHVAEIVSLDFAYPEPSTHEKVNIIKVAWWDRHPIRLPRARARHSEYKSGTSIAIDTQGRLRALLHTTRDARFVSDRQDFLRQLVESSILLDPDDVPGDGQGARHVHTDLDHRDLRIMGALRALHGAGMGE
ncbi:hypothetical protein [Microbacterium sp. NPDC056569]|uniref:hypothetical protein n=1 Tax=Microbacterium sp. NPDC056569 TaxID=3345867 RepID=UPI003670BA0B